MQQLKMITLFIILFSLSLFAEEKKVSLVTCEWEPFYGSKLPQNGFFSEIVRQAFREKGYTVEFTFIEWAKALEAAKNNKYNGILGAYYNLEREKYFNFSYPVYTAKIIFIARKEINCIYDGNLRNLENYRIGISKGFINSEEFDSADYLTKIEASGPQELIKLIVENKVDLILIGSDVAQYLLKNNYPDDINKLKALGPSFAEKKLYVPISRLDPHHKEIIHDFNEGLKILIKDDRIDKIHQEHFKRVMQ